MPSPTPISRSTKTVIHDKHYYSSTKGALSSYLHYSSGNEGANGVYNKLTNGFSGCIETIKVMPISSNKYVKSLV